MRLDTHHAHNTSLRLSARLVSAALLLTLGLIAGGCQQTYTDYGAFVQEPQPTVMAHEYRMAPPDRISITSKRVREINGHSEIIRSDGMISLPLLGSVYVAGKTPEEAGLEIQRLAQEYYEDADVSMRVSTYASKKFFVFGEVRQPGAYPFTGNNSIIKTLAFAQPSRIADVQKIHVIRPNPDGELRKMMTIDFDHMVRSGDNTLDAKLREGDIIYVPPTGFASVGLALQQLLLPITPAASVVNTPATTIEDATGSRPYGDPQ